MIIETLLKPARALVSRIREFITPRFRHRTLHAYCVGLMKTGTHSIYELMKDNYRAEHEWRTADLFEAAMSDWPQAKRDLFIQRRNRRLWFDMDSSVFNLPFVPEYVRLFPEAKFILTIRDCYSWVDSCFNHQLARDNSDMQDFLHWWFKPEQFEYAPEEAILKEKGLFPLSCYLSFWAEHNQQVISAVPAPNLLIIKTKEIGDQLPAIAAFLDIPENTLTPRGAHAFKAAAKFGVLAQMDPEYVKQVADRYCTPLMAEHFSDVIFPAK